MKVFLIDDLKITNLVNKKCLSGEVEGIEIMDFEDPKKALMALPVEMPDLIFLDLCMPAVSGWDILTYMKKENLHIPVVILTSTDCEADRNRAVMFGNVISFQIKPLSKIVMNGLVTSILNKNSKRVG